MREVNGYSLQSQQWNITSRFYILESACQDSKALFDIMLSVWDLKTINSKTAIVEAKIRRMLRV
jgi:hypothetical protein